jgi:subtilisin family serine protease
VPIVAMVATPAALDALRANPAVARIDEDELDHATLEQSVPQIGAADAHDRGYGGSGWTVAVLDTGAETNHEFLRGATVDEACYSSTENCPNSFTNQLGPGSAAPCTYAAGCDHGTHTAGIAIGLGPASRPNLQGVANLGLLFPIQVFGEYTGTDCDAAGMDPCALSAASDQIAGLVRVFSQRTAHNIAAVNMSIGGGDYSSYCDTDPRKSAIDNLRSAGIATVISAGNDGYIGAVGAPGCISTAITVGAVDKSDVVPQFSNASTMVDLLAPGVDILSSVPGNAYAYKDGTSMAAPHVAGAFAVMKSWTSTLSVDDGESLLKSSGKPIADQGAGGLVKPRINVLKAMDKEMEQIANDQVIDHRNPIPYAHEFMTTSTAHYWSGVAVRPPSTGDVDLTVYDTNVYTGVLAGSTLAGNTIDFVVQDNNNGRRVLGDLTFPLVNQYSGTGRYQIEYDNQAATN